MVDEDGYQDLLQGEHTGGDASLDAPPPTPVRGSPATGSAQAAAGTVKVQTAAAASGVKQTIDNFNRTARGAMKPFGRPEVTSVDNSEDWGFPGVGCAV